MRRAGALSTLLAAALLAAPVAAQLADPTRPARHATRAAQAAPDALTLRAVVIREGHRSAVIGERRVGVGDTVAGGRVVAIDLTGVRLRRDGREIVLTLGGGGDLKQPASGSRAGTGGDGE